MKAVPVIPGQLSSNKFFIRVDAVIQAAQSVLQSLGAKAIRIAGSGYRIRPLSSVKCHTPDTLIDVGGYRLQFHINLSGNNKRLLEVSYAKANRQKIKDYPERVPK